MGKTIVRGAVVGGIILFIWGFISWMVLPWHNATMMRFTNERDVARVIQDNAPIDGMYMLPSCQGNDNSEQARADFRQKLENGPFVFAAVRPNGMGGMHAGHFIKSLIIQIIAAAVATWLLTRTRGLDYLQRVGFVTMVAFFAGVAVMLPAWNWMGYTTGYTIIGIIDLLIGWTLAGFALAKITK